MRVPPPPRSRAKIVTVVAIVTAAVGAAWLAFSPGTPQGAVLKPDDATVVARGKSVYVAQCASCHGANLEGQPNWQQRDAQGLLPAPPHDPSGHTWHHPDEQLFLIVKHGVAKAAGLAGYRSAMPAYDGVMSDDDIVAVLSYIKAQWPAPIRARHDEINRQAHGH
jgi:mono/diheme cytochrome c family protein